MSDTKEINFGRDNIREAVHVKQSEPHLGHSGGPAAGAKALRRRPNDNPRVIRHVESKGRPATRTIIRWIRPSDGELFTMEADIDGVANAHGIIPDDLIWAIRLLCPICAPSAPRVGPGREQGQILVRGYDVGAHMHPEEVWDPQYQKLYHPLTLSERLRCPFLCGWHVRIVEGVAENVRGMRNLWSKIPWAS